LRREKGFHFFRVYRPEQVNFELGRIVGKFFRLGECDRKVIFIEARILRLGQFDQSLSVIPPFFTLLCIRKSSFSIGCASAKGLS